MPDPRELYAAREDALEADALDHAHGVLLANCEGVLCFDEAEVSIKFVCDPRTGQLVASVPVASLLASENILWVPEYTDDALHLLLSPEQIDECAITDRWQAYHGEPEHVRWGSFWIDSAKHGPWVFDGDALMRPNPLAPGEPALINTLNAEPSVLIAMCKAHAHVEVHQPLCVGIDSAGLHVRARFGIVRIRFPERAGSVDEARTMIGTLMES